MPIYEYTCKQCGKLIDILQKMSDPAPEKCEGCGAQGTLERVVSRTSFVLKGGGWGSDLYGSKKKDAKKEGGEGASTPESGSGSGSGSGDKAAAAPSSGTSPGTSSTAPAASPAPASSSSTEKK